MLSNEFISHGEDAFDHSEIDGVYAEIDNSTELEQTSSLPMSILVLNVCASLLDVLSVGDILFTLTCKDVH